MHGFLLDVFTRTRRGRSVICAIGRREDGATFGLLDDRVRPVCYVRADDAAAAAPMCADHNATIAPCDLATMDGAALHAVTLPEVRALPRLGEALLNAGIRTYEADLALPTQYLMQCGVRGAVRLEGAAEAGSGVDALYRNPTLTTSDREPDLCVLSFDIETSRRADAVFGVSLVSWGGPDGEDREAILLAAPAHPADPPGAVACGDEAGLLKAFTARVQALDPDILTGWNILEFDLPVLAKRFAARGIPFELGRGRDGTSVRPATAEHRAHIRIQGRQVLDAMRLVRGSLERYEDYRLKTVAETVLGRGKLLDTEDDDNEDMPERIARAFREDRATFCDYCVEDARLVRDILRSKGLIELTVRRSMLTGLPLERATGSVAAFEYLYISALHREGVAAPTLGVDQDAGQGVAGGLVMDAAAGLHHGILVFDFRSLYPSIMRTFNIDPLAYVRARAQPDTDAVEAPNGIRFARTPALLPVMLDTFFARRAAAREAGDTLAAYAYKIIMNSFYGVLGTPGCRFASPHIAGTITAFGHHLLQWARRHMEAQGFRVLYGDTDSLFVDAGFPRDIAAAEALARGESIRADCNAALADMVRQTWRVAPRLDLELEKFYRRMFVPAMRGDRERGRAKGYAGLRADAEGETLEVVGMEAVRRDWTDLAHRLQRELLMMAFRDAAAADVERHVSDRVAELRAGRCDDALIYRKGLRKPVAAYTSNRPPHVKAAMLLRKPGNVIRYVVTTAGPQPIQRQTAPIDYDHYVDKQVWPIVAAIAPHIGADPHAAVRGEQRLL